MRVYEPAAMPLLSSVETELLQLNVYVGVPPVVVTSMNPSVPPQVVGTETVMVLMPIAAGSEIITVPPSVQPFASVTE